MTTNKTEENDVEAVIINSPEPLRHRQLIRQKLFNLTLRIKSRFQQKQNQKKKRINEIKKKQIVESESIQSSALSTEKCPQWGGFFHPPNTKIKIRMTNTCPVNKMLYAMYIIIHTRKENIWNNFLRNSVASVIC